MSQNVSSPSHPYDRIMGWVLPAIVAVTPFVYSIVLGIPHMAQTFFFQVVTSIAFAGLGVAWMMGWRRIPRRLDPFVYLILFMGLAVGLSVIQSKSVVFSIKKMLLPLSALMFFTMLVLQPDRRRVFQRIVNVLMVVGGALALYGIVQYFGFDFLQYSSEVEKNRVIATIGHPNYLASVLGPIVFAALGVIYARRRFGWTLLCSGLIFVILYCIMLARTRAVWLGLIVGVVGFILIGMRYGIRHRIGLREIRRLGVGIGLVVVGLVVGIHFVLQVLNAPIDVVERIRSDKEIRSRLYYWNAAIDKGFEKPVFGQGYAMYDTLFWDYALDQQKTPLGPYYYDVIPAISGGNPGNVHNEYLEVFCEQGFVGLSALFALLGFFVFFGYCSIMRNPDPHWVFQILAMYGALLMILVDAMFSFPWHLPISLLIFTIILAWLYDAIHPQTTEQS